MPCFMARKKLCTSLMRGAVTAASGLQVCNYWTLCPTFCRLHFARFLVQLIPLLYQATRDKQIYNKHLKRHPLKKSEGEETKRQKTHPENCYSIFKEIPIHSFTTELLGCATSSWKRMARYIQAGLCSPGLVSLSCASVSCLLPNLFSQRT